MKNCKNRKLHLDDPYKFFLFLLLLLLYFSTNAISNGILIILT